MTSEFAPAPGSLRYFAVLFAPASARAVLEALYGFEDEVRRTVEASAHEVAHARLQWWRGEVDRLVAGRPSHPVALALLPLRERGGVDLALLHELLVAADLDLAGFSYRDRGELEAYCYRATGVLQTLAASATAGVRALSEPERRYARQLGSALRQVEMIRDFRHDLRRGRLYLTLDALESAGLDPHDLARASVGTALNDLLDGWRADVAQSLRTLPATLPEPAQRTDQRHGLVLAALYAKLLERTRRVPVDGDERVELGSINRLWTAWRTAVRHA